MAKSKTPGKRSTTGPRSFSGVIRGRSRAVQRLAEALRSLVIEELPDVEESYYGGQKPMAMYRTAADVCWIQPLTSRCNVYFPSGTELDDTDGVLEGSGKRIRHVKVRDEDAVDQLPLRDLIRQTVAINAAAVASGLSVDEVLQKLRSFALLLPATKETITWGKPHFRVKEKIFCGCGEQNGQPVLGLKLTATDAKQMMTAPGITKAPYSRPNDGWISIAPNEFDDWDEIRRMVLQSFRLVAPKKILKQLDDA